MSQIAEHIPAPIPPNEEARLQVVHCSCLLDTPPEEMFDDLTRLAAGVFNVPTVLISIIDRHRQYFLSAVGSGLRETSRQVSFCAHTLTSEEPLIVTDARQDPRFYANPLVTGEPFIRFYAGAPLVGRGAHRLGTLCVIDTKPHVDFTREHYRELQRFASLASHLIEQRLLKRDLREANERFTLATKASTDGIFDLDCRSGDLYCSARWNSILGFPGRDTYTRVEDLLARIHPTDYEQVTARWKDITATREPELELEYRCRHENGSWRRLRTRLFCQWGTDGSLLRVTGSTKDITAGRRVDSLTGIHNRISMLERLQSRIDNKAKYPRSYGVLFVDLDTFKRVNDSLGHKCGDFLLVGVAHRLEQTVHGSGCSLVSRLGGDEFVILIDDVEAAEDLLTYASMLEHLLAMPVNFEGNQVFISASIGVVFGGSADYESAERVLEDADLAMYRAKLRGKAQNAIFSERMREESRERLRLESDLREALKNQELEVWYQPKIWLGTGAMKGFEALVRWRHPARGMIPPVQFIPVAEEIGLISEIGRWVALKAISQLADWRIKGVVPDHATMAVNVSPRQFKEADLLRFFQMQLASFEIPAACLVIEATESLLVEDSVDSLALLQSIVNAGIGLDLDDFGTGYSSLSYLHRFPFRSIKIDRSFVSRMSTDSDSVPLIASIVSLAKSLKMNTIAEGVENEDQARCLRDMGCDAAQGFLFSPPRPAQEIERYIRERVTPPPAGSKAEIVSFPARENQPAADVWSNLAQPGEMKMPSLSKARAQRQKSIKTRTFR